MSDDASSGTPALVKLAVPLARSMMLTDTFRAAGRSAMILNDDERPAGSGSPSRREAMGPQASGTLRPTAMPDRS